MTGTFSLLGGKHEALVVEVIKWQREKLLPQKPKQKRKTETETIPRSAGAGSLTLGCVLPPRSLAGSDVTGRETRTAVWPPAGGARQGLMNDNGRGRAELATLR